LAASRFGPPARRVALAGVGLCLCAVPAPGLGQVVERHAPASPVVAAPALPPAPPPVVSEDDHPLGANLRALVLLGPDDPTAGDASPGVTVSPALPRLSQGAATRLLGAYIGQPISRALISRVEASIVGEWRREGFPLVSVSTPEQEIGQGVLRIRVLEFRVGKVKIAGAAWREAGPIWRGVALAPGDPIDGRKLTRDLDWLGRYPFRSIEPAFTPGAAPGETDIDLAVTARRPWQVEAGYANSGVSPTDENRYFVGVTVGGLGAADSLLSVLITGSPDFWVSHGTVLGEPHPTYESISSRLTAPTGARQELDLTLDAIETNQPVQAFMVREQTLETSLVWRASLSNLIPLPGDVRLGVEAQSQRRTTFFGPTAVSAGGVNIYQFVGGWSRDWSDRFGHAALDVAIHVAPGGLDRLNSAASLADFTSGRAASATYAYLDLNYDRTTPIVRGFSVVTQFVGQYAARPLPDSDQMGLGGQGAVRGYYLGAGAFDDALILRDELRAPALALLWSGPAASQIGPFAFVDFGYGRNDATRKGQDFAAIGLGADLQVSRWMAANLSLSYPLATAPYTPAGAWRLEASVTLSY
jgi:hemolysin activation/secretion protein